MSSVLTLRQGDSTTYTEAVSGLASLTGYTGKLYMYDPAKYHVATFTGTPSGLSFIYDIVNENSKGWPLGTYWLISKVFDASDHVYSTSDFYLIVQEPGTNDPS